MGEIAEFRATVVALDRDAEQTQLPEFGPEIPRKQVAFIDLRRSRCDAVRSETAYGIAQQIQLFAVTKVELEHG